MAIAKGAKLPPERTLDAVHATELAIGRFAEWATVRASELPDGMDKIDAMQIKLAAWQADRFAGAPTSDVHMTLGVIEELGEAFDEDAEAEDAVDALGDVMIYAAQLCTANRLAVAHVIALGAVYAATNRCHQQPAAIAGNLAHVVLKYDQGIRGLGAVDAYRPRLVDALALMIGKALENACVGYDLQIDPGGVFVAIGAEVLARKQGDAMIPETAPARGLIAEDGATVPPRGSDKMRAEAAFEQFQAGAELLAEAEAGGDTAHDIAQYPTSDPGPR